MSAAVLVAGTVMNTAASLLNDTARSSYTYAVQVPYLNVAMRELQEFFQLRNIPVTDKVSAVLAIPAGDTEITYDSTPALPSDMVEPEEVWERTTGTDPFYMMKRVDTLINPEGLVFTRFGVYSWYGQKITFYESSQDNDLKLVYTRELFTPITDETDDINIINAQTFLEYKTAALMAEFIEHNKPTSDSLHGYASLAIDRAAGIGIKGTQSMVARRRPFRASWRRNNFGIR